MSHTVQLALLFCVLGAATAHASPSAAPPAFTLVQDDDDDDDEDRRRQRKKSPRPDDDVEPERKPTGMLGTFLSMGTGCCCGSGAAAGAGCCMTGCGCAFSPLSLVRDASSLPAVLAYMAVSMTVGGIISLVGAVLLASNLGGFATVAFILYKMNLLNLNAALMMFSMAAT